MRHIKELLLYTADVLRDYERDSLAAQVEDAAEALGEPVAQTGRRFHSIDEAQLECTAMALRVTCPKCKWQSYAVTTPIGATTSSAGGVEAGAGGAYGRDD